MEFAANNLNEIVEGIGVLSHDVWADKIGMRLKDTDEWVRFYVALKNLTKQEKG